MNVRNLKGSLFLLVATIIWGCTFVAQDIVANANLIGSFEFHAVRTLIGAVVLVPVILIADAVKKKQGTYEKPTPKSRKTLLMGGLVCGAFHCLAANLQQVGMTLGTSSGKAGFITAMYIIFVPIIGLLFKKKIQPHIYGCIVCAVVGLYLLCAFGDSGFSQISVGDFITLLCAVAFAMHILAVDNFVEKTDCIKLSCLQFVFSGLMATVLTFVFENGFHPSYVIKLIGPILFAGVLSCGIAYTFQVIGQKYSSSSTVASLIMSFESVVSVIASAIYLGAFLKTHEYVGCTLMFVAVIASQIDFGAIFKKRKV